MQALEKEYRATAFSQNPEFLAARKELYDNVPGAWVEDAEYVHHTAFNAGYREGFALAKKQGESALHSAIEILRCSEERVEMLEDSLSDFIY